MKLLKYAEETAGRTDFRYHAVDSTYIPEKESVADMVVFFSVATHMLNEEFYVYLLEARRVLKPKGRIIFSFLDFQVPQLWAVFNVAVAALLTGRTIPHLNVFIGRSDIPVWSKMLGMPMIDIIPGDTAFPDFEPANTDRHRSLGGGKEIRTISSGSGEAVLNWP